MNEQEQFEAWWKEDCDTTMNPYSNTSMMYWAWEAWKAGRKVEREWVGLTENEKELLWDEAVDGREHFCSQYGDFADAIEAKLKEKNT